MKAYLFTLLASTISVSYQSNEFIKKLCTYGNANKVTQALKTTEFIGYKNDCFVDACRGGNYHLVSHLLLDKDLDHDIVGEFGLMEAIKEGEVDVVKLLLNDPRIEWVSESNYRLIMAAISKRQEKIVEVMLKHRRAVKALDQETRDVLGSSIKALSKEEKKERRLAHLNKHSGSGNERNVQRMLLGKPASTFKKCFSIAYGESNLDVVKYLLSRTEIDPTEGNSWYLYKAAKDGNLPMLDLVVKTGKFDMAHQGGQALAAACASNRSSIVAYLLKAGVDPSFNNGLPMRMACRHRSSAAVFQLTEAGVDPSANDNEAIQISSAAGAESIVEYLMVFDAVDPSANHNFALRMAAYNGYEKVVDLLMSDPRVDPSDNDNAALRSVVYRPHSLKIIPRLMKDKRVDPSSRNNFAFKVAMKKGFKEVAEKLASDPRVLAKMTPEERDELLYSKL